MKDLSKLLEEMVEKQIDDYTAGETPKSSHYPIDPRKAGMRRVSSYVLGSSDSPGESKITEEEKQQKIDFDLEVLVPSANVFLDKETANQNAFLKAIETIGVKQKESFKEKFKLINDFLSEETAEKDLHKNLSSLYLISSIITTFLKNDESAFGLINESIVASMIENATNVGHLGDATDVEIGQGAQKRHLSIKTVKSIENAMINPKTIRDKLVRINKERGDREGALEFYIFVTEHTKGESINLKLYCGLLNDKGMNLAFSKQASTQKSNFRKQIMEMKELLFEASFIKNVYGQLQSNLTPENKKFSDAIEKRLSELEEYSGDKAKRKEEGITEIINVLKDPEALSSPKKVMPGSYPRYFPLNQQLMNAYRQDNGKMMADLMQKLDALGDTSQSINAEQYEKLLQLNDQFGMNFKIELTPRTDEFKLTRNFIDMLQPIPGEEKFSDILIFDRKSLTGKINKNNQQIISQIHNMRDNLKDFVNSFNGLTLSEPKDKLGHFQQAVKTSKDITTSTEEVAKTLAVPAEITKESLFEKYAPSPIEEQEEKEKSLKIDFEMFFPSVDSLTAKENYSNEEFSKSMKKLGVHRAGSIKEKFKLISDSFSTSKARSPQTNLRRLYGNLSIASAFYNNYENRSAFGILNEYMIAAMYPGAQAVGKEFGAVDITVGNRNISIKTVTKLDNASINPNTFWKMYYENKNSGFTGMELFVFITEGDVLNFRSGLLTADSVSTLFANSFPIEEALKKLPMNKLSERESTSDANTETILSLREILTGKKTISAQEYKKIHEIYEQLPNLRVTEKSRKLSNEVMKILKSEGQQAEEDANNILYLNPEKIVDSFKANNGSLYKSMQNLHDNLGGFINSFNVFSTSKSSPEKPKQLERAIMASKKITFSTEEVGKELGTSLASRTSAKQESKSVDDYQPGDSPRPSQGSTVEPEFRRSVSFLGAQPRLTAEEITLEEVIDLLIKKK